MEFLLILCGASLALGLFFIAADLFKLPRLATQKALLSAGRQEKKQARTTDVLLMGWAVKLAPHIHMDEYKHSRLKNTLNAAGLGMTPEEYTAFAIVKAAAVMLGVIPCLFLFPLLALVVILLAVMVYFKEIRRADEKLSGKRDEIESELPRFVATITQELANSRDVLSMVEHYKQNAGATFAAELDILTADMRSGSYEAALTRFEARFNSPLLSDVVMVSRLYEKWGISDTTDFGRLKPEDYPILSDLYDLIEEEYQGYDADAHQLYTAELLQEILLGLHSMCKGAEAKFFNGHTNVTSSRFIVFGVKGLLQANRSVRGAMLFNILSFMSDRLLTIGNTTAVLDELYVWLSDKITSRSDEKGGWK